MKHDYLFENSCLFADLVLFAIFCYISALGVATMAGQLIVTLGIAVTAVAFVVLATKEMGPVIDNRAIAHHQA